MKTEFWQERWKEGQIGFHQEEINAYLLEHWPKFDVSEECRVFVPLCGKSKDMIWLQGRGHDVFGVELSPLAVDAFFDENNLAYEKQPSDEFLKYTTPGITLWCGDFFKLDASELNGIEAVYDRASLIALPPAMREQYAQKLTEILQRGVSVLLVTMEYPQQQMDGPPFSVSEDEVRRLYGDHFQIDVVGEYDVLANNERFRQRGLSQLMEKSYALKRL